ncbi:sortase family protein [Parvibaculum lavamentivorans DS-1]|uniref:Sortase family protein n=1 Tax=Parvibaculum lavamentivorans (strain DS-1 / DSM 13023 / NCIMB 13966) TaxID=402881 RepID=A7HVH5_PARL1|nr:class GN sortase [Parvibaculum lavamentivorans]ABS63908.1 sortase family protein [Parvibaculum lavamentivorans DS-1]
MTIGQKKKAVALAWATAILLCLGFGTWQLGHGLYINAKAQLAQVLLERAWQMTLADGKPHKAWPWADTWPVAKLEIPSLGLTQIVLSNASGEALAFGPGHLVGSPQPGRGGMTVIAGHRDTHFSFLSGLKNDDHVIVSTADGVSHRYIVGQSEILDSGLVRIDPFSRPGIAFVTCYPFDSKEQGPLRYVVFASPAPDAG